MENLAPGVEPRNTITPVAWGALALACLGILMYAGFVTHGDHEIANIAFGKWPYLLYLLLFICFANIGLDLWLKGKWMIAHIKSARTQSEVLKQEAKELSARIPGSDPVKVERMLKERRG